MKITNFTVYCRDCGSEFIKMKWKSGVVVDGEWVYFKSNGSIEFKCSECGNAGFLELDFNVGAE